MSARGRKTRLIGSSTSSNGGQSSSRPRRRLLAGRHQVGLDPPGGDRGRGGLADGGDLEARERARVEPVLVELLAHRLDRVDRRERDPLVATLDQTADRLVHLLRVARRLDRDRRHLLGHRAVACAAGADSAPACSLVRGTSTRQPNSGLVSNQLSVLAQVDDIDRPRRPRPRRPSPSATSAATLVQRRHERSLRRWWCRTHVTATGVSPGRGRPRPAPAAIADRWSTADSSTRVLVAAVSRPVDRLPADAERRSTSSVPRSVSGTPAYAGTATDSGTPGTTSTPIPALRQALRLLRRRRRARTGHRRAAAPRARRPWRA